MKDTIKQLVYDAIILLKLDSILVMWSQKIPLFKKLIPPHTKYKENSTRIILRDGTYFNVDNADYMQWYLFVDAPDLSINAAMQHITENSIVLDIGANIGHFSLKIANLVNRLPRLKNTEIHAFEPNSYTAKIFSENLSLNSQISERVILHQIAMGSSDGSADFYSDKKNSGSSHFTFNEIANEKVRVSKLDSFTSTILPNKLVSFIKIDVEGYEPEVFEGGWQTIQKCKPTLYFEFSPYLYKTRGVDYYQILEKLNSMNYSFLIEKDKELTSVEFDEFNRIPIHQTNILATPNPCLV